MKASWNSLHQGIALGLISLLVVPLANAAPPQTQGTSQTQAQQQGSQPATNNASGSGSPLPAAPQANQPNGTQSSQQQNHQPVGTAAAPYENPVGVPVSRPAGAAIAPAKQRRTRSFLIKMSLVVGAAVAVGTVIALSKGSSSRPNQ